MKEVLVKSVGFILIVIIGYLLKRKGFFKQQDGVLLSRIIMNITLPAALIAGASGMVIDITTLSIIVVSFIINICILNFSKFINRRSEPRKRAINMINCTGYNIGNFAIPFAASFFEPIALAYMCMFDIGNSFMVLGGSYSIAKNEFDGNGELSIKKIIKDLLSSVPFDVYLLLFLISILKIKIPNEIISISLMIGSANSFLAMLMIGIMLEININRSQIKSVVKLLGNRYILNAIIGIIVYLILPMPILVRKMIVLILFSPLPTMSVVYSNKILEDDPTSAIANSISIIVGISIMTGLLLIFV